MVRTRFAPSPTGYLHIGGVRTALFNWLFARKHKGQFVLRIDDTDRQRNVEEALAPILHGLKWLGIDWDEGPEVGGPHEPYSQSARQPHYRAAVEKLLDSGHAYHDFARPEEIQVQRQAAQQQGRHFVYDRRWMAESDDQRQRFQAEGRNGIVRLKMPREGTLVIDDHVRGQVEFEWSREQDHVIQRADGSFLYHLATVQDDHDFKISHVIRAEEHLSNTPRQAFIAQSLGYALPQYVHLPYVAEPSSRSKLSKRKLAKYLKNPEFAQLNEHGQRIMAQMGMEPNAETFNPVIVDFYERSGYLPDAINNCLLLLGWSLDDRTEFFTREEMIEAFTLERVNKAPASFDPAKLAAFQERYMRQLPMKQKVAMTLPFLQRAALVTSPPPCDVGPKLTQILRAAGDRVSVAGDILQYKTFFVASDQLAYDEKAFDKRIRNAPVSAELLRKFRPRLARIEPFDAKSLEAELKDFVAAEAIKIGQIIHALRVAVTGQAVGFGLFETLEVLGQKTCLARIDQALERLESA